MMATRPSGGLACAYIGTVKSSKVNRSNVNVTLPLQPKEHNSFGSRNDKGRDGAQNIMPVDVSSYARNQTFGLGSDGNRLEKIAFLTLSPFGQ